MAQVCFDKGTFGEIRHLSDDGLHIDAVEVKLAEGFSGEIGALAVSTPGDEQIMVLQRMLEFIDVDHADFPRISRAIVWNRPNC